MKKNIRVTEPSAEMQMKIRRARIAIASQKRRTMECPYCHHNTIIVFEDTRGHVQAKCKLCGRETVFNVQYEKVISPPQQRIRSLTNKYLIAVLWSR